MFNAGIAQLYHCAKAPPNHLPRQALCKNGALSQCPMAPTHLAILPVLHRNGTVGQCAQVPTNLAFLRVLRRNGTVSQSQCSTASINYLEIKRAKKIRLESPRRKYPSFFESCLSNAESTAEHNEDRKYPLKYIYFPHNYYLFYSSPDPGKSLLLRKHFSHLHWPRCSSPANPII